LGLPAPPVGMLGFDAFFAFAMWRAPLHLSFG
jgi:hypothetical protein